MTGISGATLLAGAKSRLLPPSLPFRFFIAACYFHCLSWAALFIGADMMADFSGGLGIPLASLHLTTIGVLTMTAIGATLQLLPVATRAPITSVFHAALVFWLLFVGLHALGLGMASGQSMPLKLGALLVALALALFIAITSHHLWNVPKPTIATHNAWAALVCLGIALVLGVLLTLDFHIGFIANHQLFALLHLVLAVFGFFGFLTTGFGTILLPMFSLATPPPYRQGLLVLALMVIAMTGVIAALALGSPRLLAIMIATAMIAALFHIILIEKALASRMRRQLGPAFTLIRLGHILLIVALGLALAQSLHGSLPRMAALFAWVTIAGWLLSFLFGVLQKIMPFLASMHAHKIAGRTPLLSEIGQMGPLRVHLLCHVTALLIVTTGVIALQPLTIRAGSVVGFAGACALFWYSINVVRHIVRRPAAASPDGRS